ncbi:MAG TPA: hypothetical protein PK950_00780 [Candidatus Paceibacterota bacterium]|nr:hypothetical protein [Candidatus Paceibacterota bacterium]
MKTTIEITNGPSVEELFAGLRYYSEGKLIPFCIKHNDTEKYVAVLVSTIQVEDGSGESWNVSLRINQQCVRESYFANSPAKKESGVIAKKVSYDEFRQLVKQDYLIGDFRKDQITVKAYFSTKYRTGAIDVQNLD